MKRPNFPKRTQTRPPKKVLPDPWPIAGDLENPMMHSPDTPIVLGQSVPDPSTFQAPSDQPRPMSHNVAAAIEPASTWVPRPPPTDAASAPPRYTVLGPAGPKPPYGSFAGKKPSDAAEADPASQNSVATPAGPTGQHETPTPLAGLNGPTGPAQEHAAPEDGPTGPTQLPEPSAVLSPRTISMGIDPSRTTIFRTREEKSRRKPVRAKSARTKVGRAVLKNSAEIELVTASFLLLIDQRLESLRQERPNSDESRAARDEAVAYCEDLKHRVESFLDVTSQFATKQAREASVVEKTNSLAAGISDWWSKHHVQICDKAFDMGLFGIGVAICALAGAGGVLAVAIPGVMAGGKPVVDALKAAVKQSRTKSE